MNVGGLKRSFAAQSTPRAFLALITTLAMIGLEARHAAQGDSLQLAFHSLGTLARTADE